MATVTHHIHSHYDPEAQEEVDERLHDESKEIERLWETERLGTSSQLRAPPRFVPASSTFSASWDAPTARAQVDDAKNDFGSWYRSLSRRTTSTQGPPPSDASTSSVRPAAPSSAPSPAPSPAHTPSVSVTSSAPPTSGQLKTKNDWFISRVLASEPPRASPSADSLAQMLAREPPPRATEQPFKPPVFLALGPENVGYGMLQQRGWNEGEALGHQSRARRREVNSVELKEHQPNVKYEETEVCVDDEITEVRRTPVVDLTLSSDEDSEDETDSTDPNMSPLPSEDTHDSSSTHVALITPLATVLKADRLGIGLKAKTQGPYRMSKKRITHGQAALAAHIHANEEVRRQKKLHGRGKRGFARINKRDQVERQDMMQYLNS